MTTKVKAGLAALSAEWFSQVGIQNDASKRYGDLPRAVESDTEAVMAAVRKHFDPVFPGRITSPAAARNAIEMFRRENVQVVIICHIMWSEDAPLIEILKAIGDLPVILWCYSPYRTLPDRMTSLELFRSSGTVGMLQGSAPMKKMGVRFGFVFGHPADPTLARGLAEYAKVIAARASLRTLRIGRIAGRCEPMTGTWFDEFRLLAALGPAIAPISAYRLREAAGAVSDADLDDFVGHLKAGYAIHGVSDRSLRLAARASLGVERLALEEGLGAVAIEDLNPELHRLLKTRPCLWTPRLAANGVVIGMEGDVISTLALWLGRQLSAATPMFTEIFTFDHEQNALLMGHAGMNDPALAGGNPVTIVPDHEYEAADEVEGAWLHFSGKAGPVTVLSLFADTSNYRLTAFRGEALSAPEKLEGFPSVFVRIAMPLSEFFRKLVSQGLTQHFAVVYDDVLDSAEKLGEMLRIECVRL